MSDEKKRYFGEWEKRGDLVTAFAPDGQREYVFGEGYKIAPEFEATFPKDEQVLFAAYTYEDYSGCAHVLFEQDGKLFEVKGSHCSCNGLEGQWEPGETTWEALKLRIPHLKEVLVDRYESYRHDSTAALISLIETKAGVANE